MSRIPSTKTLSSSHYRWTNTLNLFLHSNEKNVEIEIDWKNERIFLIIRQLSSLNRIDLISLRALGLNNNVLYLNKIKKREKMRAMRYDVTFRRDEIAIGPCYSEFPTVSINFTRAHVKSNTILEGNSIEKL